MDFQRDQPAETDERVVAVGGDAQGNYPGLEITVDQIKAQRSTIQDQREEITVLRKRVADIQDVKGNFEDIGA